jgi:glutamate-5-semialdehyde dehydrogenase
VSISTPPLQARALAQVHEVLARSRVAANRLREADSTAKDEALHRMADALLAGSDELLAANATDLEAGRTGRDGGLSEASLQRLRLSEAGIAGLVDGLRRVAELPDPVDELPRDDSPSTGTTTSQLLRLPLGVVGVVYEAQPAVTVEITGLVLKAGNAVLLRGGPAAGRSDAVLAEVLRGALDASGLPADGVQLLSSTQRSSIQHLITARGLVDIVVVRGGRSLIRSTGSEARVPTIELGPDNCHVYIDAAADLTLAEQVVLDSKLRQPALPHAAHTVLVHADVAARMLPAMAEALRSSKVRMLGDRRVVELVPDATPSTDDDWNGECLSDELAITVVDSADDAIAHINQYGAGSPQVIVTADPLVARSFVARLNVASVRVNLATGTADADGREAGGLFATQTLHSRGPVLPAAFTTTKWVTWPAGGLTAG